MGRKHRPVGGRSAMTIAFAPSVIDAETWNGQIADSAQVSLLQQWEYAAAKVATSAWTVERGYLSDGAVQIGAAQVLIRKLPFKLGGLAWINRAPICFASADPKIPHACIEALARHYGQERGYYLRIAAPLPRDSGIGDAPSPSGWRMTATPGWASARLDLTLPEDVLRKNLRANWRNKLRKAEQMEIEITSGTAPDLFARFIGLHKQFLADKKFSTSVTVDFLENLQAILPESRKMMVHTAAQQGELLSAVLIARYGKTCEYLAGSSADHATGMPLGQLLLWQAIMEAKRQDYATFDLSGMEPGVTPKGIYDFKEGVNPLPYVLTNEIEAGYQGIVQKSLRAYVNRLRA